VKRGAEGAVALSLERMNAVEEIDVQGSTMTVQAGVPLEKLQQEAEKIGLMFPMDLGARGDLTLSAGCEDPGTLSLRAEGDLSLAASDRVEITARTEIVLRCGASEVVISPRGVEIRAPRVSIKGEDGMEAVGDGTRLSLGSEEALVSARRVRLYSEGASVSLDRDAHVRGREVLLNCDDDPRPDAPADPRDPARVPLRLRVTDAALNPLAHKHFHVDAGGETLKGETDGDGWVRVRVLEAARAARVIVWTDAYPRGARREWTVTLGRLAPVASPKGLKERLRNLGWYEGAVDNDDDDALALALRSFQEDNGLPPHGAPDDATRAKITALHGA
jgi:type VI secretion system secreted protein VgrG